MFLGLNERNLFSHIGTCHRATVEINVAYSNGDLLCCSQASRRAWPIHFSLLGLQFLLRACREETLSRDSTGYPSLPQNSFCERPMFSFKRRGFFWKEQIQCFYFLVYSSFSHLRSVVQYFLILKNSEPRNLKFYQRSRNLVDCSVIYTKSSKLDFKSHC